MSTERKTFTIDELPKDVQAKVLDEHRFDNDYTWAGEVMDSLEAFAEVLNFKVKNYSIDWYNPQNSTIDIEKDNITTTRIFSEHEVNNCDLTGYYIDSVLMSTWNETQDVDSCIDSFLDSCHLDYMEQIKDSSIIDYLWDAGYEFYEDGTEV